MSEEDKTLLLNVKAAPTNIFLLLSNGETLATFGIEASKIFSYAFRIFEVIKRMNSVRPRFCGVEKRRVEALVEANAMTTRGSGPFDDDKHIVARLLQIKNIHKIYIRSVEKNHKRYKKSQFRGPNKRIIDFELFSDLFLENHVKN